MLSLIDPTTVPPGGFRYTQPETKTKLSAPSLPELLVKVRDHRLANNLPIRLEWKQEVEESLCNELPSGFCRHVYSPRDTPLAAADRALSVYEVLAGAKLMGAWLFKGFNKVSQEEADARARICRACHFNQPATGCTTCASNAMREAVTAALGSSRTADHDSLHTCNVCGCTLQVAVWAPQDLIEKFSTKNTQAPEWCWKNRP